MQTQTVTLPRTVIEDLYDRLLSGQFYRDYDADLDRVGLLRAALAQRTDNCIVDRSPTTSLN